MRDAVEAVVDVEFEPPPLRAVDVGLVVVVAVVVVVVDGRWVKHRADGKVHVEGGVRDRGALAPVGSEAPVVEAEEGVSEDMELRKWFMMCVVGCSR